mmetsp:Transcript_46871/g.77822  ORF Transcript_46871/g.77822 Transcript_46871/m.77822 type:complete len:321 (-) Transcript_46871:392-1354(-)
MISTFREITQRRKQIVLAHGLKYTRRADKARHARGQSAGKDADNDERRPSGDFRHNLIIIPQSSRFAIANIAQDASAQRPRNADIDHGRDQDRRDGTHGNVHFGLLQITADICPCHLASHRREEHGKHRNEIRLVIDIVGIPVRTKGVRCVASVAKCVGLRCCHAKCAHEIYDNRDDEYDNEYHIKFDDTSDTPQRQQQNERERHFSPQHDIPKRATRDIRRVLRHNCLGKAGEVHGNRDAVGKCEQNTNNTAKFRSQGSRNDEIIAARFDFSIGTNSGQRQRSEKRHRCRQQHNDGGLPNASIAHNPASAQIHNHTPDA